MEISWIGFNVSDGKLKIKDRGRQRLGMLDELIKDMNSQAKTEAS